jgi:hypothetical protein
MRRMMVLGGMLAVLAGGCSAGHGPSLVHGPVIFDVTYHNEAWGYTLRGWYIDDAGDIYRFDHSDAAWTADADTISDTALFEKLSRNRERVGRVPADELAAMTALLPAAAAGALTPVEARCADGGTTTDQAWVRIPGRRDYARVLLHQRGDEWRANLSPAAATLYAWLSAATNDTLPGCGER